MGRYGTCAAWAQKKGMCEGQVAGRARTCHGLREAESALGGWCSQPDRAACELNFSCHLLGKCLMFGYGVSSR